MLLLKTGKSEDREKGNKLFNSNCLKFKMHWEKSQLVCRILTLWAAVQFFFLHVQANQAQLSKESLQSFLVPNLQLFLL